MATNPPFFTGDEDEDEGAAEAAYFASLGLPDYDNPVSVPTPYDSRVGGAAVWFGGNGGEASSSDGGRKGGGGSVSAASRSAGTYGPPSCTSCGAQLFLVAQIYAPVEYARALAIFGCNRPECSRRSSTWRVIRTQDTQDIDPWKLAQQDGTTGQGESVATSTSADNANSGAFTKSASMVSQPSTSLLQYREVAEATKARVDGMETSGMIDGKDGDGGWGGGGLFGDDDDAFCFGANDGDEDDVVDGLEELLRLRDHSRQHSAGKKGKPKGKAPGALAAPVTPLAAPSAAAPPPSQAVSGAANAATITSTPPTEDASSADLFSFRSHYLYNIDEPNAKHVAYDSVAASVEKAMKLHGKSANLGGTQTEGMNAVDKYEETPAEEKALNRFQERVLRAPSQCVRYAYGGTPLWPSAKGLPHVPKCPGCGGHRVFELQLMSPVLHVLDVDKHEATKSAIASVDVTSATTSIQAAAIEDAHDGRVVSQKEGGWQTVSGGDGGGGGLNATPQTVKNAKKRSKKRKQARKKARATSSSSSSSVSASSSSATAQLAGGGGMDFATVLVYSCENSCEQSNEEFAVVHEPL